MENVTLADRISQLRNEAVSAGDRASKFGGLLMAGVGIEAMSIAGKAPLIAIASLAPMIGGGVGVVRFGLESVQISREIGALVAVQAQQDSLEI